MWRWNSLLWCVPLNTYLHWHLFAILLCNHLDRLSTTLLSLFRISPSRMLLWYLKISLLQLSSLIQIIYNVIVKSNKNILFSCTYLLCKLRNKSTFCRYINWENRYRDVIVITRSLIPKILSCRAIQKIISRAKLSEV